MAYQWLNQIQQTATIDEADQLAVRLLQAAFEPGRASYRKVGFDAAPFAKSLGALVAVARQAHAEREVAQNLYELESEERRQAVAAVKAWVEQLHLAGRYAQVSGHPLGGRMPKMVFTADTETDTWRQGVYALATLVINVGKLGDLTSLGLPADFHARGVALQERMLRERDEATEAETQRFFATNRLESMLEQIIAHFEQISAARDLAMALSGEALPGLELSLVKAAAAPRGTRASVETPSTPTPVPPVTAPESETGL